MTYGIVIGILILALLATLIAVVVEKPAPLEESKADVDPDPAVAPATIAAVAFEPQVREDPTQPIPGIPQPVIDESLVFAEEFNSTSPDSIEVDVDDPSMWRFDPETGEPIEHPPTEMASSASEPDPVDTEWSAADAEPVYVLEDEPDGAQHVPEQIPAQDEPDDVTDSYQPMEEPATDESGSTESTEGPDSNPGTFRI